MSVGKRPVHRLIGLFVAVCVLGILSMGVGAVWIGPLDVLGLLTGFREGNASAIVFQYRLPRILLAILAGAGLGVSGAILQGVIRNPLASPDVIGITKGAGLTAVITMLFFPKAPVYVMPLAAFVGAIGVAVALYGFAYKRGLRPATLALVGIALGALCHAFIQYFMIKFPVEVNAALAWLSGSIWGKNWVDVGVLIPWVGVLVPLVLLLSAKLDILRLGDDVASGLGENVNQLRFLLLFIAVALAGACVAVVGTMGFVGLVAPHMAKRLLHNHHRYVLPASAAIGMLLLLAADGLGRGLVPPLEIPAGIFTALIGAPYFLFLLRRQK